MSAKLALQYTGFGIVLCSLFIVITMLRNRSYRQYVALFSLIIVRGLTTAITVALMFYRKQLGLTYDQRYKMYFGTYWTSAVVQMFLELAVIYAAYRIAMKPLEGLRRIGTLIFRWVAGVSLVLSLVVALGPHAISTNYLATLFGQFQEGVSVLTLCLLLFVCFAARPLGLALNSRVFGAVLGLGVASCFALVLSAWFSTQTAQSVYSPVYVAGEIGSLLGMMIWGVYFALPEPERKLVLLPTTSPYFLWNRISEALGDEPGVVAIAGFRPSMLAAAEMKALVATQQPAELPAVASAAILPEPIAVGAR